MLQIFPDVGDIDIASLYADDRRIRLPHRPWIILSMVSSADGAIEVDGTSGPLANATDRHVFGYLRSRAAGILVGAQTFRRETYSPVPAHQTLIVFSRSGDLGPTGRVHTEAGNTRVVSGTPLDIVSTLDGEVWMLEGGPNLNAQMLEADLVDEICLTIAPEFVSGGSPRISQGISSRDRKWSLAHVAHDDGYLFLRYVRSRPS